MLKFENRKVKSFMDNVNWEHFSIAFIYDLIKSGKTDIVVSEDQKKSHHKNTALICYLR